MIIRSSAGRQLEALITLIPPNSDGIDAHALIDSGCTGSCIDSRFVERYGIPTKRYPNPLRVSNADGTDNEGGLITEYAEVELVFDSHRETINLAVTTLSSSNVFLGYDWLSKHNPEIDWQSQKLKFTCCPTRYILNMVNIQNEDLDQIEIPRLLKAQTQGLAGALIQQTWTLC